eukprot:7818293-Pyramimonas_sp.AAC.1
MGAYGDESRIRAFLVSCGGGCELFSAVRGCRCLGVSVGPDAHLQPSPAQCDKYFFRVCKIRLVGAGLAESIVAYIARAVTALSYVLQFHRPTSRLSMLEDRALQILHAGPRYSFGSPTMLNLTDTG